MSAPEGSIPTKRLRILSPSEIEHLYGRPQLIEEERIVLFELHDDEHNLLTNGMSVARKVNAIIQWGYFKLKQQFFRFQLQEVQDDIEHILQRYFNTSTLDKKTLSRDAVYNNQRWILDKTGYQLFSQKRHASLLLNKSYQLCRLSVNPVFIFNELLTLLSQQKITLPGYSTLQKIIAKALVMEQARINPIFKEHLAPDERAQLVSLFEKEENFYAITLLKQQPKNFKATAIYQEVAYYQQYQTLYQIAKRLLPLLGISANAIIYYANLVEHYTVQALHRMASDQTCLWLICFVFHRCQRMLDNLATLFIYTANAYKQSATQQAKTLLLVHTLTPDEKNKTIVKLLRIYIDNTINEDQPFKDIKALVYNMVPPERIDQIADELDEEGSQKLSPFMWQAVDELAKTYRPLLRALAKTLVLEGEQHKPLQSAYSFLRTQLINGQSLSTIPYEAFLTTFINAKNSPFIFNHDKKTVQGDRYEYECYQQVAHYINGRSLFLTDGINYRSLQAALLPQWEETKSTLLEQVNKPLLNQPFSRFIEEKAKPLDEKIMAINEAIRQGENQFIRTKEDKDGAVTWTLPYTKKDLELNNPFYEQLPAVSIIRVLQFVDEKTHFMRQFTHIKPHYSKSSLDEKAIYACLIANGTNLGIIRMASICDLDLPSLNMTEKNYLRLSTLRAANDVISNAIAKLPIFCHWNLQPDVLHASVDGQKFITERDNLLARYSSKYFGFDRGVVAYSLIANHVPINTSIMGANEHESRFLFDLIYNNTSDIQPDVFSTDTEGSNQLNFLLLHLIERLYAPRYRSLMNKTETLVSFSDPVAFKDGIIKPQRKINEKLILMEEDNVQHILTSLLMGETRQSTVIAKLSSQQLASRTKQAMWEMNAVLMSDHLLNYLSDLTFRESIQGALCRGEAYHQLRRHVETVNGRHFRGSNEMEIATWNECARLLTNCLIYYNSAFLDTWLEQSERQGDMQQGAFIKQLSPVAWIHINFRGKYEFLTGEEAIDMESWLKQLSINEKDFKKKS